MLLWRISMGAGGYRSLWDSPDSVGDSGAYSDAAILDIERGVMYPLEREMSVSYMKISRSSFHIS